MVFSIHFLATPKCRRKEVGRLLQAGGAEALAFFFFQECPRMS